MSERCLSVFIDESGDFGPYEPHAPYYLVSIVLHDQSVDVSGDIDAFEEHLARWGYARHAIHTGPLIRRESVYAHDLLEERKRLYNALFHFTRRLDIRYAYAMVKKAECPDVITLTARLSKALASILRDHEAFWSSFDRVIVYYDNGQIELTKILIGVLGTLLADVEFRKVAPVDYKLFQVADFICTTELLAEKETFTRSELEFFDNRRDFRKNYLKPIRKKLLSE